MRKSTLAAALCGALAVGAVAVGTSVSYADPSVVISAEVDVSELDPDVSPIFECWTLESDETYTAYFGYENRTTDDGVPVGVVLPYGPQNNLTPSGFDGLQPDEFGVPDVVPGRPGRTAFGPAEPNAFVVSGWNGVGNIVWNLDGRSATAGVSREDQECPTPATGKIVVRVFDDTNNDGTDRKPNDDGVQGATVQLLEDGVVVEGPKTTGRNGFVSFRDVPIGDYTIEVTGLPGLFTFDRSPNPADPPVDPVGRRPAYVGTSEYQVGPENFVERVNGNDEAWVRFSAIEILSDDESLEVDGSTGGENDLPFQGTLTCFVNDQPEDCGGEIPPPVLFEVDSNGDILVEPLSDTTRTFPLLLTVTVQGAGRSGELLGVRNVNDEPVDVVPTCFEEPAVDLNDFCLFRDTLVGSTNDRVIEVKLIGDPRFRFR